MIREFLGRLTGRSAAQTDAQQAARTMRELRRQSARLSRTREPNDYLTDDLRYTPHGGPTP